MQLRGNDGDNVITGSLFGADGREDAMYGEEGDDRFVIRSLVAPTYIIGGAGNDIADYSGLTEGGEINLQYTDSIELVIGTAYDDVLYGNGYGLLKGGAGNDVYYLRYEGENLIGEVAGDGYDTVVVQLDAYTLGDHVEALVGSPQTVRGPEGGPSWVDAGQSLTGNALNNRIEGGDGNDIIDGGAGADEMWGGGGNDLFIVDHQDDRVTSRGFATVRSSVSFSIAGMYANNLTLSGSDDLDATGNGSDNVLLGNGGANILDGGAGDDRLDGGGIDGLGVDVLKGGLGDDLFILSDSPARTQVVEAAGEGYDRVEAAFSYALGSYVEALTLTGAEAIDGTGNGLANVLTGNEAGNRLHGGGGNDLLDGGGGADMLYGEAGDDRYLVDDAGDRVFELAGAGMDSVTASVDYSLAGQYLEALTLTGAAVSGTGNGLDNMLTGNALANRLRGGGGNDILDGGAAADRMAGETGNDLYVVDSEYDEVVELDGQGYDSVESAVSYSLAGRYVEALTLTGIRSVNATGNSLDNLLTGNAAANRLRGGAGDDRLAGGAGKDVLEGGSGADRFVFDAAPLAKNADRITDFVSGEDSIHVSRAAFAGMRVGTLHATSFALGTAAGDADDRIVYDSATGNIFFDADGSGAGAALLFATVNAGTVLTAADFVGF